MKTYCVRLFRTPIFRASPEVQALSAEESEKLAIALDDKELLTWDMSCDGPAEVDEVDERTGAEVGS